MNKLRKKLVNLAARLYFAVSGSPLKQEEHLSGEGSSATKGMPELLRRAAAEGAVLLENDGTLPFTGKIALFGRMQTDTFYVGYGSGGDVIKPYRVSILEGLERADVPLVKELRERYLAFSEKHPVKRGGWGEWPYGYPEMPIENSLVSRARGETDTAAVVIGRAAGEDMDCAAKRGSYYLSEAERELLSAVTEAFPHVAVILNVGNPIDVSELLSYRVGAVLLIWQGGMETGNACADLLTGKVSPCGKLADTFARSYSDYPSSENFGDALRNEYGEGLFVGYRHFETNAGEKILYPFGYGLSYTSFSVKAEYEGGKVKYSVKNTGKRAGREVVQVYAKKPAEGSPARELVAFRKTALLAPGEEERGEIPIEDRALCSFLPDRGAFCLGGKYTLYAGTDSHSAREIATFEREFCAVQPAEKLSWEFPSPPELPAGKECDFSDVRAGRASLEEFVALLSDEELQSLAYGALKMNSPLGPSGNAGVMGGTTEKLQKRGIPPVPMTDGPSGIRLNRASSLLPCGTLLGCTFDPDLVKEVYRGVGGEMRERGSRVLLAPAMNLHRDPLCGRNFEYYSEDTLLTGKLAAAVLGVQSMGVSACPKHFCCNNQEFNRNRNDSVLSERTLRELYLCGFEICVKEGRPHFLMTSYNKINGVYAHYNAALVRGVLRGEWGFDGCVVTDWWMRKGSCPGAGKKKNNGARVYAGVNVLMPGAGYLGKKYQHGGLLKGLGKKGRLTRGELQKNACEVLAAILKTERE